jgi:hypothetical protein
MSVTVRVNGTHDVEAYGISVFLSAHITWNGKLSLSLPPRVAYTTLASTHAICNIMDSLSSYP